MTNQDLQDKYGYVVKGWDGPRFLKIGDVLPRSYYKEEPQGPRKCLESPLVVVGFSTIEEWHKQSVERGDAHCYNWNYAKNYQIVKVIAE